MLDSFGSTYPKIGTIQRRLAWPLHKDDMQICEVFHIKKKKKSCHRKKSRHSYSKERPWKTDSEEDTILQLSGALL